MEIKKESFKQRNSLYTALGLIKGCCFIEEMEDFSKEGLIKTLKEVRQILEKFLSSE